MMNGFSVRAEAPSNIALIKYMGKVTNPEGHLIGSGLGAGGGGNLPTNPSLSFTLPHLRTTVSIQATEIVQARWQVEATGRPFPLSPEGQRKFLAHWDRCHQRMAPGFSGGVVITSGNNFPSDCGLASSASSFAALTKACYEFFRQMGVLEGDWRDEDMAQLSREGSGSSCRSFFAPWVFWEGDQVEALPSVWEDLRHSVILADESKKKVSSSQAHQRVLTSGLFEGRRARAEKRCEAFRKNLRSPHSWSHLFELAWAEFWDMHALFETSSPPFYYLTPKSLMALRTLQNEWEERGDGPLITMDAGPNIHLLYRADQGALQWEQEKKLEALDLRVLNPLVEGSSFVHHLD